MIESGFFFSYLFVFIRGKNNLAYMLKDCRKFETYREAMQKIR